MQQTMDAIRMFFGRATPVIPELFNMAYAITGNYESAEYVLQYTLMEAWNGEYHVRMGFREGLRNTIRRVAVEEALHAGEKAGVFGWSGLAQTDGEPVLALLAAEDDDVRRVVALRYGCGFPAAKIGRLMGLSAARVKEMLNRFERIALRRMPRIDPKKFEQLLGKAVRNEFSAVGADMPSMSAIYQSFESEAMEVRRPKRLLRRIVKRAMMLLLAVACAVLFWLAAVLIQPVPMEEPPQIITEAGQ